MNIIIDKYTLLFEEFISDQKKMGPVLFGFALLLVFSTAWTIGVNMKYGIEHLIYRDLRKELHYLHEQYHFVEENSPDLFYQMNKYFPIFKNYEMLHGVMSNIILPVTRDLAHIECDLPKGKCLTKRKVPFSNDMYVLVFNLNEDPSRRNPRCVYKFSPEGDTFFVKAFLKRELSFCK